MGVFYTLGIVISISKTIYTAWGGAAYLSDNSTDVHIDEGHGKWRTIDYRDAICQSDYIITSHDEDAEEIWPEDEGYEIDPYRTLECHEPKEWDEHGNPTILVAEYPDHSGCYHSVMECEYEY